MRDIVVLVIPFLALAVAPVQAEERTPLPEIIIGAPAHAEENGNKQPAPHGASGGPAAEKFERCVDVVIGSEKSFGCMNEKLKRQVDRVNPPVLNVPPIDARSSDLKVGTVNVPAVQQQYGRNFGVSAFPYRPPPPVYIAPVGPTARH
ncbi:hypothetical protein [Bradyrhizobium sp. ARR65]|uniref:hypothetical protein n=1 Tax=Bradyrhizobium sp. ARR65 TaxID=1040989 RepID=UPI000B028F2A|nr:hypothetical protein [Bradyrhizobium sp. ARR65]